MRTITPASEVLLRHGPHVVTLQASLRAAVALDNTQGGIGGLYDQTSRLSFTAIKTVVRCTATDRQQAEQLLAYTSTQPLLPFMLDAQAACAEVIRDLLPTDTGQNTGDTIPLRDYFADLFKHATGWLGWTPSDVWAASIGEIEAAMNAYCDKVIATSGGTAKTDTRANEAQRQANIDAGLDPDFDRAGLQRLKAKHL